MKSTRHGWTLIELMVSTAVLGVLLALFAESLTATQHAWLFSRTATEMTRAADEARSSLGCIRHATLQPRPRYDVTLDKSVPDSDLHFVCGPVQELIPSVPGACGDAIFFQRAGPDGSLQNALQACGFFVQYGDDNAWRPAFLRQARPRKRFRLLQFHQPADQFALFRPPAPATLTRRPDLYAWFAQPLSASAAGSRDSVSVVAENVIFIRVRAGPSDPACYDSRRHLWDSDAPAGAVSRHRLPQAIEATLLITDEAGWAKLDSAGIDDFSLGLFNSDKGENTHAQSADGGLAALREKLEARGMRTRVVVVAMALCRNP